MMRIELKSGEFIYIEGQEDLLNLIEDHLGESVKNEIEETILDLGYTVESKNDEMVSYESTLDSYNAFLFDIKDDIEAVKNEFDKTRINKDKIYKMLHDIEENINNFL